MTRMPPAAGCSNGSAIRWKACCDTSAAHRQASRGTPGSTRASARLGTWNENGAARAPSFVVVGRSGREGRSAPAGGRRIRILDHELRAFEALLVIDLGADEVLVAHRVDQQRDTVLLHRGVVLVLDLVEREPVLEARAAA